MVLSGTEEELCLSNCDSPDGSPSMDLSPLVSYHLAICYPVEAINNLMKNIKKHHCLY